MAAVGNRRKEELSAILAAPPYPSLKGAAEQLGLSAQSVYNLASEDPAWNEAWKAARAQDLAERLAHSREELAALTTDAVRVAGELLTSDEDRVKLAVAFKIIEHSLGSARQNVDLTSDGQPFRFTIAIDGKARDE